MKKKLTYINIKIYCWKGYSQDWYLLVSFDADFDAEVEVEDFDVEMFELDWLTECVYYLDIVVTVFDVAVAVVDVVFLYYYNI